MKKHTCIICGEPTDRPFQAAFAHFWLWHPGMTQYLRWNIKTFGFWSGLSGTLGLMCPAYNTLRNWKYRKHRLVIPGAEDIRQESDE